MGRSVTGSGLRTPPRARSAWLWLLMAACALGLLPGEALAESAPSREYQIKAAFLFNFARFVEWPSSAFPESETPIRIGILGTDPFTAALDETIRGELIRNRRIEIHRGRRIEELRHCHLLFISASERGRLADILAACNKEAILTVSDADNFALNGGMIGFLVAGNKVRFEINPGVAQGHKLKLSAQLLSLGKTVASDPQKAGGN